jgi:hypothetical protein
VGSVAPKNDVVGILLHESEIYQNGFYLILLAEAPMSAEAMMAGEFVTTAQMGEKWQVTIPKRYRDALKLETGAPAAAPRLGAGLLLIP